MTATTPTAVEIARYGELAEDIVYLRARGLLVAPFRGDYRIGQEIVGADELKARAASERARRAASGVAPKMIENAAPPDPRKRSSGPLQPEPLAEDLRPPQPEPKARDRAGARSAMCPCGRPVRPSHGRCWAIRGLDGPPGKAANGVDLSAADAGRLSKPSSPAASAVTPGPPPGREPAVKHGQGTRSGSKSAEWTEVTREHARVRDGTPLTVGVGRHYGLHIMAQASLLAELGWTAKETVRLFADVEAGQVMLRPDKTGHYNLSRQKLGGAICRLGKIPGLRVGSFAMVAAGYRIDGNRLVIDLPEQIASGTQ